MSLPSCLGLVFIPAKADRERVLGYDDFGGRPPFLVHRAERRNEHVEPAHWIPGGRSHMSGACWPHGGLPLAWKGAPVTAGIDAFRRSRIPSVRASPALMANTVMFAVMGYASYRENLYKWAGSGGTFVYLDKNGHELHRKET